MTARLLFLPTLLVATFTASAAMAGDAATAEALFRQGRTLMDAGNFKEACPKLEESFAQDPATGTLLALGICQERAGSTASAWATYAEVASRAKKDGRTDREAAARDHLAALEPKLSRLTIQVDASTAAVPGLVVKRDGRSVGQGAWGTPVPLDPGDHVVEAAAPGKKTFESKITIGAEADSQTVSVPALTDDASAPAPVSGPGPDDGAPEADRKGSGFSLRTAGLIVGGAGIVTLGVSAYFGLHAKGLVSDSKAGGHCDAQNQCDAEGGAKRDDAKSAANVATATVLAGAALTAVGVTLFIVGGPKKKDANAAWVRATPVVGPRETAMVVEGRF